MTPTQYAAHLEANPIEGLVATLDGDALHLVCGRARVTLRPDPDDREGAIEDLPHIRNPNNRLGRNRPDTVWATLVDVVCHCLIAVKPELGESIDDLRKPGLYGDGLRLYFDCERGKAWRDGNRKRAMSIEAALKGEAMVNDLRRYADLALSGRPHPLLRLAQDGAQPGAALDERRLGLVARVLVELTNAALYGHGSDEYLEGKTLDLLHAVDELAAEMGEESPLSAEAASEITHGQCVEVPGATALARLLTHYPSNVAWRADVDELYAWSQA